MYQEANRIFDTLLRLEPERRAEALDALCGDDVMLHELVSDLLSRSSGTFAIDLDLTGDILTGISAEPDEPVAPLLPEGLEIIRELGRGGMGAVYEAREVGSGERLAVKVLHAWVPERIRESFAREAQALMELRCPSIPRIQRILSGDGSLVIAMEMIDGVPLLDGIGGLPLGERVALLAEIAEIVQFAHDHGIIHRDLKPSNIMLDRGGRPWVVDFGIAALGSVHLKQTGTLAYVAPEQLQGAPPDVRADVYGLGALGFSLLLDGDVPIDTRGLSMAELLERKHHPIAIPDTVPAPLRVLLDAALRSEPAQRLPSARLLAQGLRRYLSPGALPQVVVAATIEAPLLGRQQEQAVLAGWLAEGVRIGSVVGPGGIGKTRLLRAAQAAAQASGRWAGRWWVELGGATTAEDVVHRVAAALGVLAAAPRSPGALPGWLASVLASRGRALVLLNTAEGCTEALMPLLERWVAASEAVFLVSSRQKLPMVRAAHLELGPLDAAAARTLLVQNAPSPIPPDVCAALVARLEGVPLAIELVAARCAAVAPRDVLAQLQAHIGPAMQASIASSWALLDDEQKRGLVGLALFQAPFSLQDAIAVLGNHTAHLITALREASLLSWRVSARDAVWYRVLDPIRDFCDSQPVAERGFLQARYLSRIVQRAASLRRCLATDAQDLGARIAEDLPELKRAMAQADDVQLAELGMLVRPLHASYSATVGGALLALLRARLGERWMAYPALLAEVITLHGFPTEGATALCEALLGHAAQAGDARLEAVATMRMAWLLRKAQRHQEAEPWFGRAVARAEALGEPALLGIALLDQLDFVRPDDDDGYDRAIALLEGHRLARLKAISNAAQSAFRDLKTERATRLAAAAIEESEALGLPRQSAVLLQILGSHLIEVGRLDEAAETTARSRRICAQIGAVLLDGFNCRSEARIALERGELARVAPLLAEARRHLSAVPEAYRERQITFFEALHAHLSGAPAVAMERYAANWAVQCHPLSVNHLRACAFAAVCCAQQGDRDGMGVWMDRYAEVSPSVPYQMNLSVALRSCAARLAPGRVADFPSYVDPYTPWLSRMMVRLLQLPGSPELLPATEAVSLPG